jgi:mannose-6-phosphate isomerase-like protein (cupin superfamily)
MVRPRTDGEVEHWCLRRVFLASKNGVEYGVQKGEERKMERPVLLSFLADNLVRANSASDQRYTEFLRVPAMSAGIYALPAGGEDLQKPHEQDEMYYVLSGRSKFICEGNVIDVVPGSCIYVARHAVHRFFEIEDDLKIMVLFAPEERSS